MLEKQEKKGITGHPKKRESLATRKKGKITGQPVMKLLTTSSVNALP